MHQLKLSCSQRNPTMWNVKHPSNYTVSIDEPMSKSFRADDLSVLLEPANLKLTLVLACNFYDWLANGDFESMWLYIFDVAKTFQSTPKTTMSIRSSTESTKFEIDCVNITPEVAQQIKIHIKEKITKNGTTKENEIKINC